MITNDEFAHWLIDYGRAWEKGDPGAAAALFTEDAAYHETPFADPMRGHAAIRRYWQSGAAESQMAVEFGYTILAIEGNLGVAHWRAVFMRVPSQTQVRLDGILTAEFDDSVRCKIFREWWHRLEM